MSKTEQDNIKSILENASKKEISKARKELDAIEPFVGHGNKPMSDLARALMTQDAAENVKKLFKTLKIDFANDPNMKDTPFRYANMLANELMVGRYTEPPRMEAFPSDIKVRKSQGELLVVKHVDIKSLCSHHLMPFFSTNDENSIGIIAYIPNPKIGDKFVNGDDIDWDRVEEDSFNKDLLGISKLQRVALWEGARPSLQENLTTFLFERVCKILDTKDVFIKLQHITHTCETIRGVKTNCGSTTTSISGGKFKTDASLRREVLL